MIAAAINCIFFVFKTLGSEIGSRILPLKEFLKNGDLNLIDIKEELQNEFNFSGNWSIWEQKKAIVVQFVDDFMALKLKNIYIYI